MNEEVTVQCPECNKTSTVFPHYTDGEAHYPCGCRLQIGDRIDGIDYKPNDDREYERLLNEAKKCERNADFMQTYPTDDPPDYEVNWQPIIEVPIEIDEYDNVDCPFHYASKEYEPKDVTKDWVRDLTGYQGFCVGSILHYLCRFPYKNGLEDVKKARWFIDELIKELEDGV